MAHNILEKGVFFLTKAKEEDNKKNYEEALHLYKKGVYCLHHTMEFYVQGKKAKEILQKKCNEYSERVFKLRNYVDNSDYKTMQRKLLGVVIIEIPDIKWNDVTGLEAAKEVLEEAVILTNRYYQEFKDKRKDILLYGPSGTGKSYLAKAVATESKSTFFSVMSSDLIFERQNKSKNLVKDLFKFALQHKPSIVFIAELDALCSSHHDLHSETARQEVKAELLVQMQSIGNDNDSGIVVIGATKTPWILDNHIRRQFGQQIYISLPDEHARFQILQKHFINIRHELTEDNLLNLAVKTHGYSSADVCNLARDALMQPIRKVYTATHFKFVSGPCPADPQKIVEDLLTPCSPEDSGSTEMTWKEVLNGKLCEPPVIIADLYKSLETFKSTVNPESLKQFDEFTKEFGVEG